MRFARRATRVAGSDDGFGLPEVLVALFIFALMSLGLLHTLTSVMSLSRDARARQVATNLAAQAIDRAREVDNLFDVLDSTEVIVLNGDEFTVHQSSQWVSDPSVDLQCGAGGGILRYKRVNIEVTWENMNTGTSPVRSDTVINPDDRLNDPSKGTILVSVTKGDGSGSGGVSVSATPISGGAAVTPVTTDSEGCAYMLQVVPGDYRIQVSKSGYVGVDQQAVARRDVTVTQGTSASASFQYDLASRYTVHLASNTPGAVEVATDMPVTFMSTYGLSVMSGVAGRDRAWNLHPFASGYTAYAGSCEAGDPEAWPPLVVGTDTFVGQRTPAVGVPPGDAITFPVPTGLVQVTITSGGYVRAEAVADPDLEHPGCSATVNLHFGNALGVRTLALPYGSWRIYSGTSSSQNTAVATITPLSLGEFVGGVLTLDPREVVAP